MHLSSWDSRGGPKEWALSCLQRSPPEAEQLALEFKRSHYAGWLDEALPALGGKSPREAARSRAGRGAVDVLLKEMENLEERSPSGEQFDFSELRRRLKFDQ